MTLKEQWARVDTYNLSFDIAFDPKHYPACEIDGSVFNASAEQQKNHNYRVANSVWNTFFKPFNKKMVTCVNILA